MSLESSVEGFVMGPLCPFVCEMNAAAQAIAWVRKAVQADLDKLLTDPEMRLLMVGGVVRL